MMRSKKTISSMSIETVASQSFLKDHILEQQTVSRHVTFLLTNISSPYLLSNHLRGALWSLCLLSVSLH